MNTRKMVVSSLGALAIVAANATFAENYNPAATVRGSQIGLSAGSSVHAQPAKRSDTMVHKAGVRGGGSADVRAIPSTPALIRSDGPFPISLGETQG